MVHLWTQVVKYLIIILFAIYTFSSFSVLKSRNGQERIRFHYSIQILTMFLIHLLAYSALFAVELKLNTLIFYAAQVGFVGLVYLIYQVIYKNCARLLVNHMCMLMLIGFIFLGRLDFPLAVKQFEIAVASIILVIFIPRLIARFHSLSKLTWLYAVIGILALGGVLVLGRVTNGANLSITVSGVTIQPSEFVKLIFVFYVACMFRRIRSFKDILITTIVAVIHVGLLIVSTDLGAALIFFVTYVVMLFAATRKPSYLAAGAGVGIVGSLAASRVFSHVRVRISAWKDPFANIHGAGYQVAQGLFAIGTGGWFGTGLYGGLPKKIPVAESDFIFAAISEELGGIFALCLILVCFGCFMMILNISMQIRDTFYKMIALGFGCVYGTQVFLNIGGVIKLIPSTGVTLPLVSAGGSSIFCTILMFAIIQGLYIYRHNEEEFHEQTNEKTPVGEKSKKRTDRNDRSRPAGRSRRSSLFDEEDIDERW